MDLIWGKREGIYFCKWGWTGDLPNSLSGKIRELFRGKPEVKRTGSRDCEARLNDRLRCIRRELSGREMYASAFRQAGKETPGHEAGRRSRKAIASVAEQWVALCGSRSVSGVHLLTLDCKETTLGGPGSLGRTD